jgi:hypothetical protein
MIKFKKVSTLGILCAIIISVLFFIANTYPSFASGKTLRLPVGQEDDTFIRIQALFIKTSLQLYPKEQAYILDPKNTTLLLVALGIKPAYWSWRFKMKEEELDLINNIAKILGLRFVSYNNLSSYKGMSCFVYNPKALASVFFEHRKELLSPDFYLGKAVDKESCLEAFKTIELEKIINSGNLDDITAQLVQLDRYLITISQITSPFSTERDTSPEPFPIGLAMGYDTLDVKLYFSLRRDLVDPQKHLYLVISDTHDLIIASRDSNIALSLLANWIRARDTAQQIIDSTLSLVPVHFKYTTPRGVYSSL